MGKEDFTAEPLPGSSLWALFYDLADAQAKIETWRIDYNEHGPHRSLNQRTPAEFIKE